MLFRRALWSVSARSLQAASFGMSLVLLTILEAEPTSSLVCGSLLYRTDALHLQCCFDRWRPAVPLRSSSPRVCSSCAALSWRRRVDDCTMTARLSRSLRAEPQLDGVGMRRVLTRRRAASEATAIGPERAKEGAGRRRGTRRGERAPSDETTRQARAKPSAKRVAGRSAHLRARQIRKRPARPSHCDAAQTHFESARNA